MKTKDDKLKFVMEAAGECVHEVFITMGHSYSGPVECEKCGIELIWQAGHTGAKNDFNPSPDDIGKLMELAKKFRKSGLIIKGINFIYDHGRADGGVICHLRLPATGINEHAKDDAEALLNALFVAKGGLEDE